MTKGCARNKMHKVMHEFKVGSLKSGGKTRVGSRKQAIAIGLSESRKACGGGSVKSRRRRGGGGSRKKSKK